jgi:hypothetical protein
VVGYREGWEAVLFLLIFLAIWQLASIGQRVTSSRRFPPPWTVEKTDPCFIVKDHAGTSLAYAYFEDESGRRGPAHLLTR